MMLSSRTAIVYGGGGSIGGAMARAFAREGATVHLVGRTQAPLDGVAEQIRGELGRYGIRVVSLRTGGIVDSFPGEEPGAAAIVDSIVGQTMLKRAATLEDVGHVAAFAASDGARSMTGTALNISCGALVD